MGEERTVEERPERRRALRFPRWQAVNPNEKYEEKDEPEDKDDADQVI